VTPKGVSGSGSSAQTQQQQHAEFTKLPVDNAHSARKHFSASPLLPPTYHATQAFSTPQPQPNQSLSQRFRPPFQPPPTFRAQNFSQTQQQQQQPFHPLPQHQHQHRPATTLSTTPIHPPSHPPNTGASASAAPFDMARFKQGIARMTQARLRVAIDKLNKSSSSSSSSSSGPGAGIPENVRREALEYAKAVLNGEIKVNNNHQP